MRLKILHNPKIVYRMGDQIFRGGRITSLNLQRRRAASWGGIPGAVANSTLSAVHLSPVSVSSDPSPIHIPDTPVEPHKLVESDIQDLAKDIRKELGGRHVELCDVAAYYFDGQGKAIRPLISILMARAINAHLNGGDSFIKTSQRQLALVSEMIHTATLVHDDVIDTSDTRRGKPSVNALFGQKKAIIGGDYILAKAGAMVARLNNDEVTQILAQVLEDLVQGEFMQMGANDGTSERFTHYIGKTFNKTASLMAYSCKGVAILGGSDESLAEMAFQYGKHVGIAFQLIDDLLDFVSSTQTMGKPAAADLQLGLATAPVLYAAQKHPQLNELIERRFSKPGDVQKALDCVHNSDGLEQTKFLAQKYCLEAVHYANTLIDSSYQKALINITEKVLNRSK
ncbi:unnamed protein product [Allacma fusca]|uniref:All trans-polyprenyl-diphosphate synthase PDSS1 n=1 Tax=Allacma fusca TaxID=39272 RepID=A0A8J2K3I8_9HEXA|nr:unnamed protein product [Allacma fusca]